MVAYRHFLLSDAYARIFDHARQGFIIAYEHLVRPFVQRRKVGSVSKPSSTLAAMIGAFNDVPSVAEQVGLWDHVRDELMA